MKTFCDAQAHLAKAVDEFTCVIDLAKTEGKVSRGVIKKLRKLQDQIRVLGSYNEPNESYEANLQLAKKNLQKLLRSFMDSSES